VNALRAVVLAMVVLFAGGARAVDVPAPTAQFFVITYSTGPSWKAGVAMKDQGLGPHVAYMKELRDTHRLFAAGPFPDSNGGMLIVKAASLEEAKDILAHDPAVIAGIFTGQVQHWVNAFEAGQSPSAFLAGP
jgi:uncharacterized protein YciI